MKSPRFIENGIKSTYKLPKPHIYFSDWNFKTYGQKPDSQKNDKKATKIFRDMVQKVIVFNGEDNIDSRTHR